MSEAQKTPVKEETDKTSFFKSPLHLLSLAVIFLILVIVAIYMNQNNVAQNATVISKTIAGPSLTLTADNLAPPTNEIVKISVWEDSGDQGVNAVQAKLSYPTDKFDFIGVDSSGSAFEIEADSKGNDGEVVLARGHKGSLTGKQQVAIVTLRSKSPGGAASLTFNDGSHLITSVNNKDILKQNNSVTITIGN